MSILEEGVKSRPKIQKALGFFTNNHDGNNSSINR